MCIYSGNDYSSSRISLLVTDDYVCVVLPGQWQNLRAEAARSQAFAREAIKGSFTRPGWDFLFLEDLITVTITPVAQNQTLVTQIRRLPDFPSAKGLRRLFQRLTRPSMDALFSAYLKAYYTQVKALPDVQGARSPAVA